MNYKNILFLIFIMVVLPSIIIAQDCLLIIAPDEFIEELQPLKRFKDCSIRQTSLLSLSDVYNTYSGVDEPEKIKRCIAAYQKSYGVEFVLLVGDCDKFPVRYCRAYNTEWGSKYYPSDLYYADLYKSGAFDDWDGDNDNIIGEMNFTGANFAQVNLDNMDLVPDVSIARIPASDVTEVQTYVNKVVDYEINTPGNWFNNALLVVDGTNEAFGDETKMNSIVPYLSGFTVYKRYHDESPYKEMTNAQRAAELNKMMNAGVGFVNYYGHGNRLSWAGWYSDSDLSSLTNTNMLPVIFATSCYTGRFHFDREYYLRRDGSIWNRTGTATPPVDYPEPATVQSYLFDIYGDESFAEHFLVKSNTGCIGYIGCVSKSEHGAWLADANRSDGLCPYFFNAYSQGLRTLGGLWTNALDRFVSDVKNIGMYHYAYIQAHKFFLYGDPTLRVGGAFTATLSGNVYNGSGGPLIAHPRYRITGNVSVPVGQTLSADSTICILFDDGKKITALGTSGFIVKSKSQTPSYLVTIGADPKAQDFISGIQVKGQLLLSNGGAIKLY